MIINANSSSVLHIGRVGENNATKVVFDISKWIEEYGNGEVTLVIEQNGVISLIKTSDPALQFEGNKVTWLVSDAFTKMEDRGQCELYYSIDNVKVRSVLFDIVVTKSLDGYEEVPPTPYDGWISQILDASAKVIAVEEKAQYVADTVIVVSQIKTDIQELQESINNKAEEAIASVDEFSEAVDDAEAWAVGQRNGIDVLSTDQTYQNNSKYYSQEANIQREDAEAWAVGKRNGSNVSSEDETYQNNSKYYSGETLKYKEDAEAWAIGQRNGSNVSSDHEQYQNNSKYYSQEANKCREDAEAWAVGQRNGVDVLSTDETHQNNAKYYCEEAKKWRDEAESIGDGTLIRETKKLIEDHLKDFNNPHKVTAELINVYTKTEVNNLINNAIGNAIRESY